MNKQNIVVTGAGGTLCSVIAVDFAKQGHNVVLVGRSLDKLQKVEEEIKAFGGFAIGAACYPECHVESRSHEEDLLHLKEKVDCGVDFLTTQMFFDNRLFYDFMSRAVGVGIGISPSNPTLGEQDGRSCDISS